MSQKITPSAPILLVDDEEQALQSYALNLRYPGLGNTVSCSDSRRVPALLAEQPYSLVMLDLCMPHMPGEELLHLIQDKYPTLPTIVITGLNEVDVAVRCMRAGSTDFLVKPVDRNRLLQAVREALGKATPEEAAPPPVEEDEAGHCVIVRDPAMLQVRQAIRAVAATGPGLAPNAGAVKLARVVAVATAE